MFPTWKYPFYVLECEETGFPDIGKPEGEALLRDTREHIFLAPSGLGYGLVHAEFGLKKQKIWWIVKFT